MKEEFKQAVQLMQAYMETHLNESITLHDLSHISHYSPFYCARIFKEVVGIPPFEYLRKRRLSEAAKQLMTDHRQIIDVAFDFVFDSHEGFTRAFAKEFGVLPKDVQKTTTMLRFFPSPNHPKEEKKMTETTPVFVQIVLRPKRKAIIKRGIKAVQYFEYCDEVGCDVWDTLVAIPNAIHEPMGMWLPEKLIKDHTSVYVQGVEVSDDYQGVIPDGFELIDLEPCEMMVFQGEPYDDEAFQENIGLVEDMIEKFNPAIYGYEWADDDAPSYQLEPQGYRGYIEAKPVRKLT